MQHNDVYCHVKLINVMQECGYNPNPNGVCHGVAHMAKQAIISNDLDRFDYLIMRLIGMSPEQLAKFASYFKKRSTSFEKLLPENSLTNDEWDMMALIEGIALYAGTNKYIHLFEGRVCAQDEKHAWMLAAPAKLRDRHTGIPVQINYGNLIDFHNGKTLSEYFDKLKSTIFSEDNHVAIVLRVFDHSISVAYDHGSNQWILVDAEQLPSKKIPPNRIASRVKEAFGNLIYNTISTDIYGPSQNIQTLNHQVSELKQWQDVQFKKSLADKCSLSATRSSTPLIVMAAYHSNIEVIKLLAQAGEITYISDIGETCLTAAARNNNVEVLKFLLDYGKFDKDFLNSRETTFSETALFLAAFHGHLAMVTLLAEHGADINLPNENGASPLYVAAQNGWYDVVDYLVGKGAHVNQATTTDNTPPLMAAAICGNAAIVQLLLERGANIDHKNTLGCTALMSAASNGNYDATKLLITCGANVHHVDENGETALNWALSTSGQSLEVAQLLLESGLDVNHPSQDGATPLFLAAQYGDIDMVCLLMRQPQIDTSICFKTNKNNMIEFAEAENIPPEKLEKLFHEHPDVDNIQLTPAMIAEFMGHNQVVELIAKKDGVEVTASTRGYFSRSMDNIDKGSLGEHSGEQLGDDTKRNSK